MRVFVSAHNVASFPEGGGHFWVYMQYVRSLALQGIDVYWLEQFDPSAAEADDARSLREFMRRMDAFGLGERVILYSNDSHSSGDEAIRFINVEHRWAEQVMASADLLLNFHYAIDPSILARFRRTALVDIDPGLLQFWISTGQLVVPEHDLYFSTGETVGTPHARFPDCGIAWHRIRPPVCLAEWPYRFDPEATSFTTISSWWGGGGKGEFITNGDGVLYENNKRVTFLEYAEVAARSKERLELALNLGLDDADGSEHVHSDADADPPTEMQSTSGVTDYVSDRIDRARMEANGWIVRHAREVSSTPDAYRSYIQSSKGEYTCVKPSCIAFQNAWISDRSLCYLASGKPVIMQDTGPSAVLPRAEGLFRFSSVDEAIAALERVGNDYRKQSRAARALAEAHFDGLRITEFMLEVALGPSTRPTSLQARSNLPA